MLPTFWILSIVVTCVDATRISVSDTDKIVEEIQSVVSEQNGAVLESRRRKEGKGGRRRRKSPSGGKGGQMGQGMMPPQGPAQQIQQQQSQLLAQRTIQSQQSQQARPAQQTKQNATVATQGGGGCSGGAKVCVVNNCPEKLVTTAGKEVTQTEWTSGSGIAITAGKGPGGGGFAGFCGTLAEFTIKPDGKVSYDISLIDGFSYPIQMDKYKCMTPDCKGQGVYPLCCDDGKGTAPDVEQLKITFCPGGDKGPGYSCCKEKKCLMNIATGDITFFENGKETSKKHVDDPTNLR